MSKRRKPNPDDVAVDQLLQDGFVVLQVPGVEITPEEWDRVIKLMPEFEPEATVYVGGGGALANPSSFHNSTVRTLRIAVFKVCREIFTNLADRCGFDRIELLIGQMIQRMPGQHSSEEWHQGQASSRNLEQGDIVLGGWLNVDDREQTFVCCPRSQELDFPLIGTNQRDFWRARSKRFVVPPRHVVIFFDNLVHGGPPSAVRQRRLNLGWRLTNSTLPFVPDIRQRLFSQSIIPLPNSRLPEMWPGIYWTNYRNKLFQLSSNFKPVMQMNTIIRSPIKVEHIFRYCPSLYKLGLPTYSKYSEEEMDFYKPFLL